MVLVINIKKKQSFPAQDAFLLAISYIDLKKIFKIKSSIVETAFKHVKWLCVKVKDLRHNISTQDDKKFNWKLDLLL